MKYLILLLMVLGGIWWIRKQRPQHNKPKHGPSVAPQIMVTCTQCGTHLPDSEAVHGLQGVYCSVTHRQQAEG